jgi:hypothetical protein
MSPFRTDGGWADGAGARLDPRCLYGDRIVETLKVLYGLYGELLYGYLYGAYTVRPSLAQLKGGVAWCSSLPFWACACDYLRQAQRGGGRADSWLEPSTHVVELL